MAATVDLGVKFLGLGVDWLVAVRGSIEGWIDGVIGLVDRSFLMMWICGCVASVGYYG